jgi:hypothetical protein
MTQNRFLGIILMISLGIIMFSSLMELSCRSPEAPAEVVVEQQELTVMPHPRFGFDLVIVPAGTQIDGFTTLEPGLYLSGDGLRHIIRELGLVPRKWTKGSE